ncbi:hypothetical protein [Mycobacterium lacus]|uniref:Uncharacterized protein n=1 Tax=Mycobacterium lacus TaxID=169765 RepID=A0A1X1Y2X1_9MYCO|nr:hypothetical protein [Mycobacterium lacus]MCV7124991.1 hypothetical protein [Mycobacterium lacus]ORW05361.1 hypothetical protein AWC15_01860 [Mycobacterium lacus]BBX99205.1 hypothetical protein MLAC_44990 [Mycobacterium lacus]
MIITGAFLAEAAAAVDNKLNVSGGVVSRFAVGPDRLARFVLVVLTESEIDGSNRRVDVEIRPPTDDEPIRMEFDVPEVAVAEFPGFAFFEIQVQLPVDGRWVIVVTGGTGAISLPLLVSEMTPPTFGL